MAGTEPDAAESANCTDVAHLLLAEFVRTWDQQFPRAHQVRPSEFTPLLADMARLIRGARSLIDSAPRS